MSYWEIRSKEIFLECGLVIEFRRMSCGLLFSVFGGVLEENKFIYIKNCILRMYVAIRRPYFTKSNRHAAFFSFEGYITINSRCYRQQLERISLSYVYARESVFFFWNVVFRTNDRKKKIMEYFWNISFMKLVLCYTSSLGNL